MCGIVGYVGARHASEVLVGGLKRLEYRGYDSAGVAVSGEGPLQVVRAVGSVEELEKRAACRGQLGVGHTRWATHGRPTEENAHPHRDCSGEFAVVHNGIIENHAELRRGLEAQGHTFRSETDTEVLSHLIEDAYEGNLHAAVRDALGRVKGSYAIAVVSNRDPGVLVCARQKAPLLLGLADHGMLVASDATAILDHTRRAATLPEGGSALLRADGVEMFDAAGKPVEAVVTELQWSLADAEKNGFDHYMLKEIHEVPQALREAFRGRLAALDRTLDLQGNMGADELGRVDRITIVACGTSYHAGLVGKGLIERLAGLPVEVELASEYRYGVPFAQAGTLVIGVSQSGETADTLEALRLAKEQGHRTLTIANVVGSTMTREADGVLYARAGPEIGVAATKTFLNTVACFALLALHLGAIRNHLTQAEFRALLSELRALPVKTEQMLHQADDLEGLAKRWIGGASHAFFLGRQLSHGIALEGALKLKEIAYVPVEGYAAGELKHGPLALLESGVPVVACMPRDETYGIMASNVDEVRARGAAVIALVDEADDEAEKHAEAVVRVPRTHPLFFGFPASMALYLLSYHVARARGCAIDKPRNLAKSVTVE